MSENAIGYLLNRAGYHHHHVPHGWRATFSSVMNERFPADKPVIDLMLAHVPKDKVEGAYNRALHLERRRELAQEWADLILQDARPANDLLAGPRR
jgi:integrase